MTILGLLIYSLLLLLLLNIDRAALEEAGLKSKIMLNSSSILTILPIAWIKNEITTEANETLSGQPVDRKTVKSMSDDLSFVTFLLGRVP